jgi:hypothetical protein
VAFDPTVATAVVPDVSFNRQNPTGLSEVTAIWYRDGETAGDGAWVLDDSPARFADDTHT